MDQMINRYKALSDETRLRILMVLLHRELCVCQLQGILGETQPKISKHLRKLKDLGVVRDDRKDQFIYYSLNWDDHVMIESLRLLSHEAADDNILIQDQERLGMAEKYLNQCSVLTKL